MRSDLDAETVALGLETVVLALLMAGEPRRSTPAAHELLEARAAGVVEVLDAALRPAGTG